MKTKKPVSHPVSKPDTLDTDVAKPTVITARAKIGTDPDFVTTVGLGNLKVTTAQGIKNDRNTDI